MTLAEYVAAVHNGGYVNTFPAQFDVDDTFVATCAALYARGEAQVQELGRTLMLNHNGDVVISGVDVQGQATGINLPQTVGNHFFGDIHCHPSASIGHANGYAAHSAEDIMSLHYHVGKPLFIRFVCSGTNIYAAVFRGGHSALQTPQILATRDGNQTLGQAYLENHCHVSSDDRNDHMATLGSNQAMTDYMRDVQRQTPGYGKEMERLSIAGAKQICADCDMGFYIGRKNTGFVLAVWGTMGMHLQ